MDDNLKKYSFYWCPKCEDYADSFCTEMHDATLITIKVGDETDKGIIKEILTINPKYHSTVDHKVILEMDSFARYFPNQVRYQKSAKASLLKIIANKILNI